MSKTLAKERQIARQMAVQALYEWLISGNDVPQIISNSLKHQNRKVDAEYFRELVYGITQCTEDLQERIGKYLGREFSRIDPVEKTILWIGTFELANRIDVPYRVVINEALENAKKFGATDSHKFINGVLDKYAKVARAEEIKSFK